MVIPTQLLTPIKWLICIFIYRWRLDQRPRRSRLHCRCGWTNQPILSRTTKDLSTCQSNPHHTPSRGLGEVHEKGHYWASTILRKTSYFMAFWTFWDHQSQEFISSGIRVKTAFWLMAKLEIATYIIHKCCFFVWFPPFLTLWLYIWFLYFNFMSS